MDKVSLTSIISHFLFTSLFQSAHLASIHSDSENCFVSRQIEQVTRGYPFWLDGRFIREYKRNNNRQYTKLSERFIWTDGTPMQYMHWNKASRPRNCTRGFCPPGEPQDSSTNLCLHGGVYSLGSSGKKIHNGQCGRYAYWPGYTWGNEHDCTEKMAFVCKRKQGYFSPYPQFAGTPQLGGIASKQSPSRQFPGPNPQLPKQSPSPQFPGPYPQLPKQSPEFPRPSPNNRYTGRIKGELIPG